MWEDEPKESGISRALGTYVRDGVFSCAGVAAGDLSSPFHIEIQGRRNWLPRGPLARLDDFFDLASLTKPLVTGSLLALAVGKGKLSLDAQVDRYLPLAKGTAWANRQIWQLASHSSGASATPEGRLEESYRELLTLRNQHNGVNHSQITACERSTLDTLFETEPSGEANNTRYSDLGFWVLGLVLESVWGTTLDSAFKEQVLRPLSLEDELEFRRWEPTQRGRAHPFSRGKSKRRDLVATVECPRRGRLLQGEVHDPLCWSLGGVAGHAGLFGSLYGVYTLTKEWLRSFRGENTIFHPATISKFWTRQRLPAGTTWALAWDTPSGQGSTAGDRWSRSGVGHLGFTGTSIWVDLKTDVIGVLLTNAAHWPGDPKRDVLKRLRRSVYDSISIAGQSRSQGGAQGAAAFGSRS